MFEPQLLATKTLKHKQSVAFTSQKRPLMKPSPAGKFPKDFQNLEQVLERLKDPKINVFVREPPALTRLPFIKRLALYFRLEALLKACRRYRLPWETGQDLPSVREEDITHWMITQRMSRNGIFMSDCAYPWQPDLEDMAELLEVQMFFSMPQDNARKSEKKRERKEVVLDQHDDDASVSSLYVEWDGSQYE